MSKLVELDEFFCAKSSQVNSLKDIHNVSPITAIHIESINQRLENYTKQALPSGLYLKQMSYVTSVPGLLFTGSLWGLVGGCNERPG